MDLAADDVEVFEEQDLLVDEVVQPFAVEHDAFAHPRDATSDFQELVELLGIFDDQIPARGVLKQECHLLRAVGRIDAGDDTAHALDAEVRVDPLLVVFGEDGGDLAPLQPQCGESQADRPGGVEERRPGMALPDAEVFFAVGRAVAQRPAAREKQLGKGVAAVHEISILADAGRGAVHRRHHDLQVLRRFQRLSPRGLTVRAPR